MLVIGSSCQMGTELVEGLRTRFGAENVRAVQVAQAVDVHVSKVWRPGRHVSHWE